MKIGYWLATGLLIVLFVLTGSMELTHNKMVAENFRLLGYPAYIMTMLGLAKVLCIAALISPWFPTVKEWAYAGGTILLVGASWSHIASHQAPTFPLIGLVFLFTSYFLWHRLRGVRAA